jgi:hypothetical protein
LDSADPIEEYDKALGIYERALEKDTVFRARHLQKGRGPLLRDL